MGRFLRLAATGLLVAPAVCTANDLQDIYREAALQDQQYQVALHQRDAAIEAHPAALAALLPQLTVTDQLAREHLHVLSSQQSGNGSINGAGDPGNTDNNGVPTIATSPTIDNYGTQAYSINFSLTLFDWAAFQTLAQSSRQVAEAQATLRSAQQQLIARSAAAYFDLLSARDSLRVDLAARDAYNDQLTQSQAKYRGGVVAVTDVRNAQASYDSSSALVITDRIALSAAARALGVMVGRPVINVASLRSDIPLVPPDPASADSWSTTAASNNPELLSAKYAAEVAQKQVTINRSKYLPTLSATGNFGRSTSHSQFGDDVITDAVGLNLNWNLYAGGTVSSGVRQAQAFYQQAQSQQELQRRTVDQNTRNDFQQVVDGIAAIRANHLAVVSNEASLEATKAGLKAGSRTETDVIVAAESLSNARKAYYQSRYYYLNSLLSLKRDSGLLNDKDLLEVDKLFTASTVPALDPGPDQPLTGDSHRPQDAPEP